MEDALRDRLSPRVRSPPRLRGRFVVLRHPLTAPRSNGEKTLLMVARDSVSSSTHTTPPALRRGNWATAWHDPPLARLGNSRIITSGRARMGFRRTEFIPFPVFGPGA